MTTAHKYAHIESERRFLLKTVPPDLDEGAGSRITDRYWAGTRLRLRRIESLNGEVIQRKLTQKYVDPGLPPEDTIITNIYLSEDEYRMFSQIKGLPLTKRRYKYLDTGSGYSIDVFEGELAGLVLAELHAGQGVLPAGAVPGFAVEEVTAESAFTGGALAGTSAVALHALLTSRFGKPAG
ncbi:MAG: hypothetical protein PVI99_01630 [Anaerolineales bacterium]|jgi:CYTH domain-containing protein